MQNSFSGHVLKKKKTDTCIFWVEYLGLRKNKQKKKPKQNNNNKNPNKQANNNNNKNPAESYKSSLQSVLRRMVISVVWRRLRRGWVRGVAR